MSAPFGGGDGVEMISKRCGDLSPLQFPSNTYFLTHLSTLIPILFWPPQRIAMVAYKKENCRLGSNIVLPFQFNDQAGLA